MSNPVKKVLLCYGGWSLLWLAFAAWGNGEAGIAAQFYLALTGLPFGLLSFYILPNGSLSCVAVAGLLGTLQWCVVAELNRRWVR